MFQKQCVWGLAHVDMLLGKAHGSQMNSGYRVRENVATSPLVQMLNMPREWASYPKCVLVGDAAPDEPLGVVVLLPAPERVAVLDFRLNPAHNTKIAIATLLDAAVVRANQLGASKLCMSRSIDRSESLAALLEAKGFVPDAEFRSFVGSIERVRLRTARVVERADMLQNASNRILLEPLGEAMLPEVRAVVDAKGLLPSVRFDEYLSAAGSGFLAREFSTVGLCAGELVGLILVFINPTDMSPTPEVLARWVAPNFRSTGLNAGLIHHSIERIKCRMPECREFVFSASNASHRETTLFARRIGARPNTALVRYALPLKAAARARED